MKMFFACVIVSVKKIKILQRHSGFNLIDSQTTTAVCAVCAGLLYKQLSRDKFSTQQGFGTDFIVCLNGEVLD